MKGDQDMEKSRLIYYKKLLLKEKNELEAGLELMSNEEKRSLKESTGELSSYDNHPADQASNTYGRELDRGIRDNSLTLLTEVNDALAKMEEGRYGICQRCGEEIKESRLEVVPQTSFCEKCKGIEENEGVRRRSLAEATIFPPFGHGFNDDNDQVEYDAEDCWQDLAQYGSSDSPQDNPAELVGDQSDKQTYTDSDEIVGSVGIEDSIFDDEIDDLEESDDEKTTFTGSIASNERKM
ncbi:TraR/DksA C4-type zinc finger protein [Halocella sp. SP3-1]|uniref:TraR/DksA C4-type zinc finger protein n=1 Tax=Halocella sp. SP3-1 TaxID=2382161 RepID=UPI000F74D7FA|nr:TraR/DksA C4-type zinc finger protein [Halocella sp. SP3-1]AZO94415.1 conjugal transfer protein TraR [Halocella sp. SP3-1]